MLRKSKTLSSPSLMTNSAHVDKTSVRCQNFLRCINFLLPWEVFNWSYLYIVCVYQISRVSHKLNSDCSMPVSEEVLLKSAEKTKTAREKKLSKILLAAANLSSFNINWSSIFEESVFCSYERDWQSILSNKTSLKKCKNSLFEKCNTTGIFAEMTWFFSQIFNSCYIYGLICCLEISYF